MFETIQRSYEESFLRPYRDDETPCCHGLNCQGIRLANRQLKGSTKPPVLFVLPAFITPGGTNFNFQCLLCLRLTVTIDWIRSWGDVDFPREITQPYANIREEYDDDAYILSLADRFTDTNIPFFGFIAPFVRFSSFKYAYEQDNESKEWKITQKNVDKRSLFHIPSRRVPIKDKRTIFVDKKSPHHPFLITLQDFSFRILQTGLFSASGPISISDDITKAIQSSVFKKESLDSLKSKPWFGQILRLHTEGRWPWANPTSPENQKKNQDVDARLALQEAIAFFIYFDEPLRHLFFNEHENGKQWIANVIQRANNWRSDCQSKIASSTVKRRCTNIWDRLYSRLKKKNKTTTSIEIDRRKLKSSLAEYTKKYKKSTINLKEVSQEDIRDLSGFLYRIRETRAAYPVSLPSSMHSNIKDEMMKHEFFYCPSCELFKGITTQGKTSSSFCYMGNENMCLNTETDAHLCFKRHSGGRKVENLYYKKFGSEAQGLYCDTPCYSIFFGEKLYALADKAYVHCSSCNQIGTLTDKRILNSNKCEKCSTPEKKETCFICTQEKKSNNKKSRWISVNLIIDGGRSASKTIWFCRRHPNTGFLHESEIWSLPLLKQRLTNASSVENKRKMSRSIQN